ncbi:MAG: hypothetical protein HFE42_00015 [Clostridia bacterium]|nr:hypothetical protein [Clostridia bacterium]
MGVHEFLGYSAPAKFRDLKGSAFLGETPKGKRKYSFANSNRSGRKRQIGCAGAKAWFCLRRNLSRISAFLPLFLSLRALAKQSRKTMRTRYRHCAERSDKAIRKTQTANPVTK